MLIRTEQEDSSQHPGPCVHLHGDCRWGEQVYACPGLSGWRGGAWSFCLGQRHRDHLPGSSGLLSERWCLYLLVCKWGDFREPEWVHPVSWEGRSGWELCSLPRTLRCGLALSRHLAFETTFANGLWSRWRQWGSPCVCKCSLWSSADGQEVNRILCVPKWALCLDSRLVPWEASGLCIYSPTLSSMCPSLCSIQEAEEWLLVAEILRPESNHWGPHSKGEEEGTLSRVDGDLQSRPAVCALLVPESIALAIRCW